MRRVEDALACGDDIGGTAVVHVAWMQQGEAEVVVGRYLSVRKFDSEYGLSLDVYGLLWLFAMPRST